MGRAGGAARARYNAPTRPSAVEDPTDAQHPRAIADELVTFARLQAMTPVQMTKTVVVAVLVLSGCGGGPASTVAGRADWATAPAGATVRLPARVTFDAMQLGIENRDTRSWREAVVEVRRPGDARIYRYRADVIVGGAVSPLLWPSCPFSVRWSSCMEARALTSTCRSARACSVDRAICAEFTGLGVPPAAERIIPRTAIPVASIHRK